MAGRTGFVHICAEHKTDIADYKCSLRDSSLTSEECDLIWDFYVAKSFAAETGTSIALDLYGWKNTNSKTDGYPALERVLAANAGISSMCIVRAKTIKDTLASLDLSNDRICITHARVAMLQRYTYELDENENISIKSKESRINALFRHMRNALAHGNTYFFDNEMCLFEDKDGSKKTASILIPMRSLIDWIFIIDMNGVIFKKEKWT